MITSNHHPEDLGYYNEAFKSRFVTLHVDELNELDIDIEMIVRKVYKPIESKYKHLLTK